MPPVLKARVAMRYLKSHPTLLLPLLLLLGVGSCHVGRSIWYYTSDIDDYKIFPERTIHNGDDAIHIPVSTQGKFPEFLYRTGPEGRDTIAFDAYLEKKNTVAFLILWNDSIQYEKYFNGYVDSSITTSFSMAKSVVSMLTGCAIEDGYLEGVHEPVLKYLPEFEGHGFDSVKIEQLLQMTADLDFRESYKSPFTKTPRFYYGRNINRTTLSLHSKYNANSQFNYQSPSTQILALLLTRALKDKTLSAYLEEKLWKPMQMEYPATWSLDEKGGMEKAFCCLNARARDFAKIGILAKNLGAWNGKQLVPKEWMKQSLKIDTAKGSASFYQYQWWIQSEHAFYADGHLGQFIYVYPEKNLIMVRLGKSTGDIHWPDLMLELAGNYDSSIQSKE